MEIFLKPYRHMAYQTMLSEDVLFHGEFYYCRLEKFHIRKFSHLNFLLVLFSQPGKRKIFFNMHVKFQDCGVLELMASFT